MPLQSTAPSLQDNPSLQSASGLMDTSEVQESSPFVFRWTGQHNDEHSNYTYSRTDWNALLEITKQLTGDPTSAYEGNFHAGGRHIVRRIKITKRGELWLARIPTIHDPTNPEWWTEERRFTMESEIATMKFISTSTGIPVPEVFAYHTRLEENPVGQPYLLMECIKGNMLFDLSDPVCLTEAQRIKIRQSLASIQCELANATLNKLGSLILTPNGGIEVGPLPAQFGFKGPFDSIVDYFSAWATYHLSFKNLQQLNDPELTQAAKSFPQQLKSATEGLISAGSSPNYPVVHPDFLMHNILLNDNYEVVGIIDWEFAHTAPIEIFAARMNMYTTFDSQRVTQHMNEEGREYMEDLIKIEMKSNVSQKVSDTFRSIYGDLGLCMQFYEEGTAVLFTSVLDRIGKQSP